jgi:hypothetical protein
MSADAAPHRWKHVLRKFVARLHKDSEGVYGYVLFPGVSLRPSIPAERVTQSADVS